MDASGKNDNNAMYVDENTSTSLSIIYRVSSNEAASLTDALSSKTKSTQRFDTLDLVVAKEADFGMLLETLEELLEVYQEERKLYDRNALFMQYHWIDLGKELNSKLSASEWIALCDKVNAPMKKTMLQSYYKDFCAEREAEEDGLTLGQAADLLKSVREYALSAANIDEGNEPSNRIWNKVYETDPVPLQFSADQSDIYSELNPNEESISAIAFLSFIRAEQKEYATTLEQVQDMIYILNAQTTVGSIESDAAQDRLPKSRFIAYLNSDANDILDPDKARVGADDMMKPLSHYWINSSHDTYLAKLPNSFLPKDIPVEVHKTVDLQAFTNLLNRGVRCLDIDTWDGPKGDPVVARKQPITGVENQNLPFVDVLCVIRSFLKSNPDTYPIILCIENHCSLDQQDIMANDLDDILESKGYLFIPTQAILSNKFDDLPSPGKLKGKVVIKNKRPKIVKRGATVMNDDFDDENDLDDIEDGDYLLHMTDADEKDQDDEKDDSGAVIRFEATGPVRSYDSSERLTPGELLIVAKREAEVAKRESRRAEKRAYDLEHEAEAAEDQARELAEQAGLEFEDVRLKALEENRVLGDESEGMEVDLAMFAKSMDSQDTGAFEALEDQGVEVQDFFGESVEGARSGFSTADANSIQAIMTEKKSLERLREADRSLALVKDALAASYESERKATEEARRAAIEARANREHADTARRRVETVKNLLRNVQDSSVSAETVVHTARTEAKISEQRASETEARASRALAIADKDRTKADAETKVEERLEIEASSAHEKCVQFTKESRSNRERMEKAAAMLDRVNEQIKLIENSGQFRREMREENNSFLNGDEDPTTSPNPRHSNKFIAKHAAKLEEREMCTKLIKEATAENATSEQKRRRAQAAFEEKAQGWKRQAEIASAARKQADRSSSIAEELAEHAEEEREAASLRHIAFEKAQKSVQTSDTNRTSIQEQLAEASRASEEASSLALESRKMSERLARDATYSNDHSTVIKRVKEAEAQAGLARKAYEAALARRKAAEADAATAKRLLETSTEVYSNAKSFAAAEIQEANNKRQMERNAIQAYSKTLICKRQAEQAKVLAKIASDDVRNKSTAEDHAQDYKNRMDKVSEASIDLSMLTCLHSVRFRYWEKSRTLPPSHMHSFPQEKFAEFVNRTRKHRERMVDFTKRHVCRTFPSVKSLRGSEVLNFDPVVQHASGCQIVAMNFHSSDERLLLNDGRFRANGSSGYVLKPDHLTREGVRSEKSERWRIGILSGSCIPKGESSVGKKAMQVGGNMNQATPLVRVSLFEGKADNNIKNRIHKTKGAKRNGLSPVWDEPTDIFDVPTSNPSVAMLLFTVWDYETQDFVAGAAIPVNCLREGYRSIALFDSQHTRSGPYAFASLLVKVQKIS